MTDKKRILFVDDEPNVLQGLRRMLRDMRHEWDMTFAENGQAALQLLADAPFDVIVSDMRMPGLDGIQLLQEVKQQYPHMVRIILSGQSDQESIMRSLGPTHRYLAKPCEIQILRETIERACMLNTQLSNPDLIRIISQLECLPSLPALYVEILEEMHKPGSSLAKAGDIISKDMGMTAKILKVANSAFFGARQQMSNPVQAATFLGLDLLKAMILHVHVFEKYEQQSLGRFSMQALGNHGAMTAKYAQVIAREATQDRQCIDEAMTAGLLHDVGKLVLAAHAPDQYDKILADGKEPVTASLVAEHEVFASTHSEIGGYLLSLWGLPDPVVEAVTFHHIPTRCGNGVFSPLTAVHVADALARDGNLGENSRLDKNYMEALGLTAQLPLWEAVCQSSIHIGESI